HSLFSDTPCALMPDVPLAVGIRHADRPKERCLRLADAGKECVKTAERLSDQGRSHMRQNHVSLVALLDAEEDGLQPEARVGMHTKNPRFAGFLNLDNLPLFSDLHFGRKILGQSQESRVVDVLSW